MSTIEHTTLLSLHDAISSQTEKVLSSLRIIYDALEYLLEAKELMYSMSMNECSENDFYDCRAQLQIQFEYFDGIFQSQPVLKHEAFELAIRMFSYQLSVHEHLFSYLTLDNLEHNLLVKQIRGNNYCLARMHLDVCYI